MDVLLTETDGTHQKGHPSKTWSDCVNVDIKSFGLSIEDDKDQWRLKITGNRLSQVFLENGR